MSSANSSIETPACTRRTLAWESTNLLNGMSRDRLSVIFGFVLAMSVLRDGWAKSLSLAPSTRRRRGRSPLALNAGTQETRIAARLDAKAKFPRLPVVVAGVEARVGLGALERKLWPLHRAHADVERKTEVIEVGYG